MQSQLMKIAKALLLIAFCAGLTALGSWIRIPFRPFQPMTLQIFFILLTGALFGKEKALIGQLLYIVLVIAGAPYFQQPAYGFPQPSFFSYPAFTQMWIKSGYLAGFVGAAFLAGKGLEREDIDFSQVILTFFTATVLIYTGGILFFVYFGIPLTQRFLAGFVTVLALDLFKAGLAAVLVYRYRLILRPGPRLPASPARRAAS